VVYRRHGGVAGELIESGNIIFRKLTAVNENSMFSSLRWRAWINGLHGNRRAVR
jgi:hypothetical protein